MRSDISSGWTAIAVAFLLVMVACTPPSPPAPTPTKPPAGVPSKAEEPTKPPAATPAAPAKALEPIRLGYTDSASGYAAPMALPRRDAVLMLEEKINRDGGLNGRPLKVIAYDDESDETKGVLTMKKLIEQDRVLAIVGTSASGISMVQAPIAEEAQIPFMVTSSMRAPVEGRKWVFKVPIGERTHVRAWYEFMKSRGLKKFGLLTVGTGLGKEVVKYVDATVAGSGLTLVVKEEYGPNDTDMRAQLTRIKAAGPEAMIVAGAEAAGAIAIRQAKEVGLNVPVVGFNALALPALMAVKEIRDGLEGYNLSGYPPNVWELLPDSEPRKKVAAQLAEMVKAKYNRPLSDWEGVAYDAMTVMVNAIKAANPDPAKVEEARGKIRNALESGTNNYVGAMITIDAYTPTEHEGSPDPKIIIMQQVKDGKIVVLK